MRRQLTRARELCLTGDFARGVPELRGCIQALQRRASSSDSPDMHQLVRDLREELEAVESYQQSLQELTLATEQMQLNQRRSMRMRELSSGSDTQETPEAMKADGETPPPRKWQKPRPVSRRRSSDPVVTKQVSNREQRMPTWAQRAGHQVHTSLAVRSLTRSRKPTVAANSRTSARLAGKENKERNGRRRPGAANRAVPASNSRHETKTRARTGRRESNQSASSAASNNDPSHGTEPSHQQETIAGKPKYSLLAKENDWVDQELIEMIERDIVEQGEEVSFDNIAGLDHTKQLLQETVMLPQIAPHLFRDGLLKPCSGVLMFGPPGTGKTLLAKAVAFECKATFFNVSASTLSSKYRGDSEKMVRILFDMARYYEPSVIFMDEIDALASTRGASSEHEASRRVKTELLVQINGVASSEQDNARVIVLAATNLPWELDEAMRRRLTKRVYVPLPDADARRALFQLNLRLAEVASDVDFGGLVTQTQGYSGDDITNVCETAKRMPVKRVYTPELLAELIKKRQDASDNLQELQHEPLTVTQDDFAEALRNVSKSVGIEQLKRFERWETEFGSK